MKKIRKIVKSVKNSLSMNYNITPGFGGFGANRNCDKFVHYMV